MEYEAPYIAAKSNCPSTVGSADVSGGLCLSPSSTPSPLKPVHSVVRCAAYVPSTSDNVFPTHPPKSSVKFALLPPAYYGLMSPVILSTISEIDSKRPFYGPRASLLLTCRLDEFLNDFGFPMPEVDVDIHGVENVSSINGVIAWGENQEDAANSLRSSGPVTRSQSMSPPSSSFAITPETQVFASASLDNRKFGSINIKLSFIFLQEGALQTKAHC